MRPATRALVEDRLDLLEGYDTAWGEEYPSEQDTQSFEHAKAGLRRALDEDRLNPEALDEIDYRVVEAESAVRLAVDRDCADAGLLEEFNPNAVYSGGRPALLRYGGKVYERRYRAGGAR